MTDDYEARVIRAQEGKLSVAKDHLLLYERQRGNMEKKFEAENAEYHAIKESTRKWRDEVNINQRILQTMREVSGSGSFDVVTEQPAQEEVQAKPSAPFPRVGRTNGEYLLDALRKAKGWRMGIPLPPSYKAQSAFEVQAIKRTLADHVDYEPLLARGGIIRVTDGNLPKGAHELEKAAKSLHLDYYAIRDEARQAYADIIAYGRRGEHYSW